MICLSCYSIRRGECGRVVRKKETKVINFHSH
jgi:hypothetical protein